MSPVSLRKHGWIYAPLAFGLFVSSCSHGSLLVALLFGARGQAGGGGENGESGGGGTTIDVSLAGAEPEQQQPQQQAAPAEVATASPPIVPDEPKEPEPVAAQPVTPPPDPTTDHATDPAKNSADSHAAAESSKGNADETNSGKLKGPSRIGFPNVAIDGDSVNGQRALLPAAVTCSDPVAGRWEALKYNILQGMWVHFTLSVHRASDGTLSGTILSRTWVGSPFDRFPPPCILGNLDETVSMNAFGRADSAGRIAFGANHAAVVSVQCPALDPGYAPDHFSGSIDSARQEFQSLNNDGASDVNAPYVFRRTGCL